MQNGNNIAPSVPNFEDFVSKITTSSPQSSCATPQHKNYVEDGIHCLPKFKIRVVQYGREFLSSFTLVSLSLLLIFLITAQINNTGKSSSLIQDSYDDDDSFHHDSNETMIRYLAFRNLSVLWLTSILGGFLGDILSIPPLLGMIVSGIFWTNTNFLQYNYGDFIRSSTDTYNQTTYGHNDYDESTWVILPETWSEVIRASGLAIILLRSGLDLNVDKALHTSGSTVIRLTCIPGLVEAFTSGIISSLIFDMPLFLGLSLGFILAAVSPALIVSEMMRLQHMGYGITKGIPSIIMAAASFDDIFAIIGFSICIGIAIRKPVQEGDPQSSNLFWSIVHGPISIIFGVFGGMICGCILSLTKVWNTKWKKSSLAMTLVLIFMYVTKYLSQAESGAIGAITTGVLASYFWRKGLPLVFSIGKDECCNHIIEENVSIVWAIIFEPLLFSVIGTSFRFRLIPDGTFWGSLVIITTGLCFRLSAAYLATSNGNKFTTTERAFIALSWTPKATVQAALCSFPLELVKHTFSNEYHLYQKYLIWCNQILSTAILGIIVSAPIGLVFIQYFGPMWLEKDGNSDSKTPYLEDKVKQKAESLSKLDRECAKLQCKYQSHFINFIGQLDYIVEELSLVSKDVDHSCRIAEARHFIQKYKSECCN